MSDLPELLVTIAQELLDATAQGLRDGGRDVPQRIFVETGNVDFPIELDGCTDQLTCFVPLIAPSFFTEGFQRRQGMAAAATLWEATFDITLLRCHPLPEDGVPDPDVTDALSKEHLRDGWQLLRSLSWMWHKKLLVPSFQMAPEDTLMGPFKPIPPKGGISGWNYTFKTSVHDQYAPEALTTV